MPPREPPTPTAEDAFFWQGVDEGRLLVRRCAACGRIEHPPSPMCRACGSVEWSTEELSGRGTIHSWIVARHPTEPDDAPLVTAVIALDEGPRMVSNLVGVEPGDIINDAPVEVEFVDVGGFRLPQFRPLEPS